MGKKRKKVTNKFLSREYLAKRAAQNLAAGYSVPKWIEFSVEMMNVGLKVQLYEARRTFSKYLSLTNRDRQFKVRFSNHKPIHRREINGDCDFFVGVTNLGVTTTSQAISAVNEYFSINDQVKNNVHDRP